MEAHKILKSPRIICAESRGCDGASGLLLCPQRAIDLARPISSLTVYWRRRLRLMLSEEKKNWFEGVQPLNQNGTDFEAPQCVACPVWAVTGLLGSIKSEEENSNWWRPLLFAFFNKFYLHAPIFPSDPGKPSTLGLGANNLSLVISYFSKVSKSVAATSGARHLHPERFPLKTQAASFSVMIAGMFPAALSSLAIHSSPQKIINDFAGAD